MARSIVKWFLIFQRYPRSAIINITGYTIIAIAGNGIQNNHEKSNTKTFEQENVSLISQNDEPLASFALTPYAFIVRYTALKVEITESIIIAISFFMGFFLIIYL